MRRNYSRLASVEEKRNIKRAITFVVLSVIFLIFLISFGIPLFARFAGFMSNLGKSDKPISINDTTPPAPPRISTPPEYTNQKTIEIIGESEPGATVFLTFNSQSKEIVADKNGKFSVKYNLNQGENTFFVYARDQANNESQKTKTYVINFDDTAPEITIETPKDGAEYFGSKQSQLTIKGQTEIGASLTINDRLVTLNDNGSFSFTATLSEGENLFNLKALDRAGNESEKSFSVSYTP